ncbi:MAG: Copper binding protein plastocyanin/azurin family [Solirubrobacteraceae bacterium]|jgi:plastocyanin|nr:Copper binding protein plastocyanin/azurin family [Solirubrobacteraceae bacterium]
MKMRRLLLATAALCLGALAAAPALAANQSVVAKTTDVYAPRTVAVKPGETVSFTNEGGDHNVIWNDGGVAPQPSVAAPPNLWPAGGVSRTFTKPGRYRFYCEAHGDPTDDFGMVGYVYVNAAGALPPAVTRLTATAARTGVRIAFRSSRAGTAKATFFRRSRGKFVRQWATTLPARNGANSQRIARALKAGSYRVDLVVTDASGVKSDKRTKTFSVR